ncbi:hypothetical protein NPX13_g11125 [Xylaria arbuscula]|uniref:C2H2-type domain-containing protein n=1 Tax=Xylaria arbuscula TaxID=114810 RepID=A0A9W8N3F7_9PEZI|nr:hypothetical protein NPX13_g11125 [Xylaria arbuscula]
MPIPPVYEESEDSDDDDERPLGLRFRTSRAPSSAPSESSTRGRSRSVGPRSRSQSRSASAGKEYFCIFSNCPRSVQPIPRRLNFLRHLKLIHKYDGDELPETVDSQDEMHGAMHTDGFLKPIKIRPGWRGENTAREKRQPQTRGRGKEIGDTRMRDIDSAAGYDEESD